MRSVSQPPRQDHKPWRGPDGFREVGPGAAERGRHLRPDHRAGPPAPLAGHHRARRPAGRRRLPVDDHSRAFRGGHRHRGRAGPARGADLGLGRVGRPAAGLLDRDHHPGAGRRRDAGSPGARRAERRAPGQPRHGLGPLPRPAGQGRRRRGRRSRRVGRGGGSRPRNRRRGDAGRVPARPARPARGQLPPADGVHRVRRHPAGRAPDRLGHVPRDRGWRPIRWRRQPGHRDHLGGPGRRGRTARAGGLDGPRRGRHGQGRIARDARPPGAGHRVR